MAAYDDWRTRNCRQLDLDGFDRPHTPWDKGPIFHLLLDLNAVGAVVGVERTINALRQQVYPRWRLYAVNAASSSDNLAVFRQHSEKDSRLTELAPAFLCSQTQTADLAKDFVAILQPGDMLPGYALACVAEESSYAPELDFVYGDEDGISRQGKFVSPILKPDWSPVLQQYRSYLGHGVFVRARKIDGDRLRQLLADDEAVINDLIRDTPRSGVRHVPRVLYSRHAGGDRFRHTSGNGRPPPDPPTWPRVAIIIPTRDQAKLLQACIVGLRERTDYPDVEMVIIDNGSTDSDAVALLSECAKQPQTKVLQRPGLFNYSALCNDGVHASTAPILLFLNNDVTVLESGWLKAMVRWSIAPTIGVVGAKLLFPRGVIQHLGVVVGLWGIAGHVYTGMHKDHRGYLGQATVPREVSAVTAACSAIERKKFEAIGGFDAEHLAIDLNDIDFCLRIGERGWTNLCTPEATLIHRQSASRGVKRDPYVFYRKEQEYFVRCWAETIRDDPFFHPALSLYAHDVALA